MLKFSPLYIYVPNIKKNIKEKRIIIEDLNNNKINVFEIINLKIGKSFNNHINNSNWIKRNTKIAYLSLTHNDRLNNNYYNQQNISHLSQYEKTESSKPKIINEK